ncbi:MAG: HD domain-containing protein [Candidatus Omnitrophota bacterium]
MKKEKKIGILLKSISFAARAHRHHFRKDKKTPYVSHPFRVCMILRQVLGVEDEEILAAAVLHDTIEDTTTDRDDLEKRFSENVAQWVSLLSKDKRMKESVREAAYLRQLKDAPLPVRLIKLADVYDNLTDAVNLSPKGQRKMGKTAMKYLSLFKGDYPAMIGVLPEIKRLANGFLR